MASAESERLSAIAEAIADGNAVDWTSTGNPDATPDDRAAVATYRDLAIVGRLFALSTNSLRSPRRERPPLEPGTTWGTLRIEAHAGRGRFGDVYRAWDPALHRVVALKLVANDDGDKPEVIDEGRLMARVRHPNVVAIHGAQRIGDVTGLSMEFIDGRTLEDELLEGGRFAAAELRDVAVAMCSALAAVHAAGLVHRDVKATNVIRETGGRLVLGDFGTGFVADAVPDRRVGLVGTPVYIAPEIFQNGAATQKSDLYSLGVLLFHLATGRFPVAGRSLVELRAAHAADDRPSLAALRPDLPIRLRLAIEQLLDPNPDRRFATAELARQALLAGADSSRWARIRVGAVALVAIVLAAWSSNRQTRNGRADASPNPEPGPVAAAVAATPESSQPPTANVAAVEPPTIPGEAEVDRNHRAISGSGRGPSAAAFAIEHLHPQLQTTMAFRGAAFDRRLIACHDRTSGDVAICNLVNGDVQVIRAARPGSANPFARNSVLLSPDGTHVAYRLNEGPGQTPQASLHVIGTGGGNAIELHRTERPSDVYVHRWLADGSALLVSQLDGDGRRVFLLAVSGSARTELYRAPPELGYLFDLSPDGRFLAVTRDVGQGDRDLAIVDLATKVETQLVRGISSFGWPLWTPDGRAIVFTAIRGSSSQLMRIRMADGAAIGPVETVWRAGRGEIRLIAFGADGSLVVNHRAGPRTVYVAPIDLSRAFAGPARLFDLSDAVDTIGADWSPDGSRVAYLRGLLGHPGGPPGMLVISTPAGRLDAEIPLPSWLPESATQARWSSDGRRIAVAYGGETPRAMTIDVIDIDTRERHRVVSGVPFAYPRWGPSGDWLYYQEDRSIRRYRLSDGARQLAYSAAGFGIQLNGGFDLAVADGTLAILATRPGTPGCVIRVVEASGASVDRHTFAEACRAIAWSRDATRILVSTMSASGLPSLWVLDRQAGDPIRLPIEAEVFHDLSISPSGDQLLFSAGNPTFLSVMVSGLQRASR